jgi:hypothetical protein
MLRIISLDKLMLLRLLKEIMPGLIQLDM